MNFIYFLVTNAAIYKDKLGACKAYFENGGGFLTAFLWAVGIALIFAAIYYIIARASFKWPSLLTWVVTLLLCGTASFVATGYETGIKQKGGAFPTVVEKQYQKKVKNTTPEQRMPLDKARTELQRQFKKSFLSSSPVNRLCWTNVVLSIIFFYVFSIIFNGLSRNGDNIPHRGLLTRRN